MSMISETVLHPRLAELYKIKIGGVGPERDTTSGKTMRAPIRYDHFQVVKQIRGDDGNFIRADEVHERPSVGDEPRSLDVRLWGDTPEENFHSELSIWKGKTTKVRTCDGVTFRNEANGSGDNPCQRGEDGTGCECKPYGRLTVMLEAAPVYGAAAVFRTTGWESTRNIQSTLVQLYADFGTLRGLPLRLEMYKATDTYKDGNQSKVSENWKVALVLRVPPEQAAQIAMDHARTMIQTKREVALLHAGVEALDAAEAADIADEFRPDPMDHTSAQTQEKIEELRTGLGLKQLTADDVGEKLNAAYTIGAVTDEEVSKMLTWLETAEPARYQEAWDTIEAKIQTMKLGDGPSLPGKSGNHVERSNEFVRQRGLIPVSVLEQTEEA